METAELLVIDVLDQLGIRAVPAARDAAHADLRIEPTGPALDVKRRALVDEPTARRLLEHWPARCLRLVVADRSTSAARRLLRDGGVGYIDLTSGEVSLHGPGLVIEASVEPARERSARRTPMRSAAGVEVAVEILLDPTTSLGVRELARRTHRAPSTVSEVTAALRAEGLIDGDARPAGPELFWQLAEHWASDAVGLETLPSSGSGARDAALGLRPDRLDQPGWALTDAVAAAEQGAPIAVRVGHPPEFLVPDLATQRRARRLLGDATSTSSAACTIRVAPAVAACAHRQRGERWPRARTLFVALDLARDVGRGREILETWTPTGASRVW